MNGATKNVGCTEMYQNIAKQICFVALTGRKFLKSKVHTKFLVKPVNKQVSA